MHTPGTRPHWPPATQLRTPRLRLEPLRVAHAREAATALDDVRLHTWTGGTPASREELEARYRRQTVGHSPDGTQGWLNWTLYHQVDGELVGTVQATLQQPPEAAEFTADLAWVVAVDHQGHGYAREAAQAVARWLRTRGVRELAAYVHPQYEASQRVARAVGLAPTRVTREGETRWSDRMP